MNAYCDRQSVEINSIAFLFDGRRLRGEQTPDELEMEDGDEIDAMLHQTGGVTIWVIALLVFVDIVFNYYLILWTMVGCVRLGLWSFKEQISCVSFNILEF